jgi:hypothetical protein
LICIIENEGHLAYLEVKPKDKIKHFREHGLTIREVKKYRLYGSDPKQVRIKLYKTRKYPHCGSSFSPVIHGFNILPRNICRILVRCSKCGELSFVLKKLKMKE